MNTKCTVLVSSCDAYSDLWNPFFKLLSIQWPQLQQYPIVLNTESLTFDYENLKIRTFQLYTKNEKVSWSKRLKETLLLIDTSYVITFLDDYFVENKANDNNQISQCISWLEQDPNTVAFYLYPLTCEGYDVNKYKGFKAVPKKAKYRINCQVAIWRRDFLINFLKENESPWDLEIYGSIRSNKYPQLIYATTNTKEKDCIFEYYPQKSISKNKWLNDELSTIFFKNGINIDFSIRGIENKNQRKKKCIHKRILNRLNHIYKTIKAKYL